MMINSGQVTKACILRAELPLGRASRTNASNTLDISSRYFVSCIFTLNPPLLANAAARLGLFGMTAKEAVMNSVLSRRTVATLLPLLFCLVSFVPVFCASASTGTIITANYGARGAAGGFLHALGASSKAACSLR